MIDEIDTAPPGRRGGIRLGVAVGACLAVVGAGMWWVGVHSAGVVDQAAAMAPLSAWTAVEERSAASPAELTGSVALGAEIPVVPVLPTGVDQLVVTSAQVRAGDTVVPGDVLATVSGRPVIAVEGPWDLYRAISPGDSGPDVVVLQDALRADGALSGPSDGEFGPTTQAALETFYRERGLTPVRGDAAQLAAVTDARAALEAATRGGGSTEPVGDDAATETTAPDEGADAGAGIDVPALRAALAAAELQAGARLPRGEIVVIPDAATVTAVAGTGALAPDAPVVTLRVGAPRAVARADVLAVVEYPVGAKVEIVAQGSPTPLAGTVTAVGEFDEGDGTAEEFPGHRVTIGFDDPAALGDLEPGTRASVRSVVPDGDRGLAVPLVALHEDSDGQYVLRRAGTDDGPQRVSVTSLAQSDGWVLVDAPGLALGDEVEVARGG